MTEKRIKHKHLRRLFDKWVTTLGLRWWTITVVYYDDPNEIIARFRQPDKGFVLANTYADWQYATAQIEVNLPRMLEQTPEEAEVAVIHELVHVLANEMREGEMHHEERVVTAITKAILWTRDTRDAT